MLRIFLDCEIALYVVHSWNTPKYGSFLKFIVELTKFRAARNFQSCSSVWGKQKKLSSCVHIFQFQTVVEEIQIIDFFIPTSKAVLLPLNSGKNGL